MLVREIMSPKVEIVAPDMSLRDAAKIMTKLNIGCLLVEDVKKAKVLGVVTDRDITCRGTAEGKDPRKTKVAEVMTEGTVFCFDDQDIEDVAQIMEAKKVHRLPVMDHYERVVGLVSLTDLALKGSRVLSGEVLKAISRYALESGPGMKRGARAKAA